MTIRRATDKPVSILQAFTSRQDGWISWDEYIHIHLLRATGIRSNEDSFEDAYDKLRDTDAFGYLMAHWVDRLGHVEDVNVIEEVFNAYRHGTFVDVRHSLGPFQISAREAVRDIKQPVAMLALQDRRADVLKYCLDQGGFRVERIFLEEAEFVDEAKDPETFKVLAQSMALRHLWKIDEESQKHLRKYRQPKHVEYRRWGRDEDGSWSGREHGALPGTEAIFNNDGILPVNW